MHRTLTSILSGSEERDRRKAVFLFFGIVGAGNEMERLTFPESARPLALRAWPNWLVRAFQDEASNCAAQTLCDNLHPVRAKRMRGGTFGFIALVLGGCTSQTASLDSARQQLLEARTDY